jgi:hypothetical protein
VKEGGGETDMMRRQRGLVSQVILSTPDNVGECTTGRMERVTLGTLFQDRNSFNKNSEGQRTREPLTVWSNSRTPSAL